MQPQSILSRTSGDAPFAIAAPAVRLCAAWSRGAKQYVDLDVAEREALADVERGLAEIARAVAEAAGLPGLRWYIGPAETAQTCGAKVLPRSLWVSFAVPNRPPGTPACEVFAALGPDGLGIGFAARTTPSDRTTASLQKWIRQSAPEVFGILKRQRQQGIRPDDWAFTVRDAPLLVDDGFADVNAWLQFQFGQQDGRSRTAVISRTLPQSEWNDLAARLIGALWAQIDRWPEACGRSGLGWRTASAADLQRARRNCQHAAPFLQGRERYNRP